MRPDRFGDPGAAGGPADDPGGTVPVQAAPISGQEQRPVATLTGGQVDRPGGPRREWDGNDLAALAGDHQCPVPALDAQALDVGAGGFADTQPVEASSEMSACSAGWPSPAATSSAPSSLRSRPVTCDS